MSRTGLLQRSAFWFSMLFCSAFMVNAVPAISEDAKNTADKVIEQDELSPKGHPPGLAKPVEAPTVFLWQEGDDTWRIRVRTQKKRKEFTGTIKVHGGKVVKIFDFSGLEAGGKKKKATDDFGKWNAERDEIQFRFQTHGGEDGFAFKVEPKVESVTFDLKTDNAYHTDQIFIGLKEVHPPKVPFTLSNNRAKPAEEAKDK